MGDYYLHLAENADIAVVSHIREAGLPDKAIDRLVTMDNVPAIKYAIPDPLGLAVLVERYPEVVWVCGLAELWAPFFWLAGGRGFTSGLANVAPEFSLDMLNALRAADYPRAMKVWAMIYPFEELRGRPDNGNNLQS
jgi:4-hydroxy-tetrahydrodipicolinate synthase